MTRFLHRIVWIVIIALVPVAVCAQPGDWGENKGRLTDAELLIQKEAVNELPPATRNFQKMERPDQSGRPGPLNYQRLLVNNPVRDINPGVQPAEMLSSGMGYTSLNHNYLKAGFGNFLTTLLEGYYSNGVEGEYQYGGRFRHQASQNGPIDGSNSGNSLNGIDLFGKVFTQGGAISGNLGYERRRSHFYGYEPPLDNQVFVRDSIRQIYQVLQAGVQFQSQASLASPLTYQAGVQFYRTTDRFDAKENQFDINLGGGYAFSEESGLRLELTQTFLRNIDTLTLNRNIFRLGGHYYMANGPFNVRIGARLAVNSDSLNDARRVAIYPDLQLKYQLIEERLSLITSFTGDLEAQTLRSFSYENPFINQQINLAHHDRQIQVLAGLESRLSRVFGFNVNAGFSKVKNLHFFVNNQDDRAVFDALYDNKAVGVWNLNGELSAEIAGFRGILKSGFYSYQTDTLAAAWHRPNMVNNLMLTYAFNQKWFFNADFYMLSGIRAREATGNEIIKLPGINDLNLKVDYVIRDGFTAFLTLNNIFARPYERYLHYQVRGFQAMAGITYSLNANNRPF